MRRVATVADDAAVRQGLGNHRVGLFARDGQMARRTVHMTNWAPQDLDVRSLKTVDLTTCATVSTFARWP
jgi:hypothetical protein